MGRYTSINRAQTDHLYFLATFLPPFFGELFLAAFFGLFLALAGLALAGEAAFTGAAATGAATGAGAAFFAMTFLTAFALGAFLAAGYKEVCMYTKRLLRIPSRPSWLPSLLLASQPLAWRRPS